MSMRPKLSLVPLLTIAEPARVTTPSPAQDAGLGGGRRLYTAHPASYIYAKVCFHHTVVGLSISGTRGAARGTHTLVAAIMHHATAWRPGAGAGAADGPGLRSGP